MSGIPLFNIPNTKRHPHGAKPLPNLTIPLPPNDNNANQPKIPANPYDLRQQQYNQQQRLQQQQQQQPPQPSFYIDHNAYSSNSSSSMSSPTTNKVEGSTSNIKRKPPPPSIHPINSNYTTDSEGDTRMTSPSPSDAVDGDHRDKQQQYQQHQQQLEYNEEDTLTVKHHLEQLTPYDWHLVANANQIIEIGKLGEGNGGSVAKCKLNQLPNNQIFALKLIITDPNPDVQKQIFRELEVARKCQHPSIVKYYGTFILEKQSMIGIAMEYMDGQSLDSIYKEVLKKDPSNRINEKVLGKITNSILAGLDYLHLKNIIHRDIKPSNILLDSQGNVKLCDFGVSGEAVNSFASTFVGTQYYMAPERITGGTYSISSDIWSLGMSLLEVANGKFPIDLTLYGPIEVVDMILKSELELCDFPEDNIYWSSEFKQFIAKCLIKDPQRRPIPRVLLREDEWCLMQLKELVRMDKFVKVVWRLNQ